MFKFLTERKVGKGKKNYLSELSKIAKDEREKILREKIRELIIDELINTGINKRIDDISENTKYLEKKFDDLKSSLVPLSRSKDDTIRKIKIKRMIIELLRKNKKMTASDVSLKLDLSRTRCSEYLKELERAGSAKGVISSRQKLYELKE